MPFLRFSIIAGLMALLCACGSSTSSSQLNNDFQIIREKSHLFREDTGIHVSCSGLNSPECIKGLDKLLAIRATAIFPTEKFVHIFLKRTFAGVDTAGFVDIDFAADVQKIEEHLATQPADYVVINGYRTLFLDQAKVHLSCSGLNNQECISGMDKLVQLSSSPIFPTDHFVHVFVKRAFDDVDTHGFVDVDFQAPLEEIREFLEKQ